MGLYSDSDSDNDQIEIKQSSFTLNKSANQVKESKKLDELQKHDEKTKFQKSLPAFLVQVNKKQVKKNEKIDSQRNFLNSVAKQVVSRNRQSSGGESEISPRSKALNVTPNSAKRQSSKTPNDDTPTLNTVIDLKNQPKHGKRPKLVSGITENGETYIIYDPFHPNEYDIIAAKLGRKPVAAIKKKIEEAKKKITKYAAYTGGSSSEDEDTRQNRGGGAQIAPPSFMDENDKDKKTMTTTPLRPKKPFQNNNKNKGPTPLFKRKQTKNHDPTKPTIVIVIKNIVGPGEVDSDLKSEVVQECQKYGKILDSKIIDISEKNNNDNVDETDAVRIFLKFSSITDSQSAVTGLNQRIFGGRVLYSAFFDVAKFDRGELDGLC